MKFLCILQALQFNHLVAVLIHFTMLHTALLLMPCVQLRTINEGGFTISLWLQENLVGDKQILQLQQDRLTIELIDFAFFSV